MKTRYKVKIDWWMHLIFFVVVISGLSPLYGYQSVPDGERIFFINWSYTDVAPNLIFLYV